MFIWQIYWTYTDDTSQVVFINAPTASECCVWFQQINHQGKTVNAVQFTRQNP